MFVFFLLVLAGLAAVAFFIVRLIKGPESGAGAEAQAAEAREIQEMHQLLERMERRIESLETILMDGQGEDGRR